MKNWELGKAAETRRRSGGPSQCEAGEQSEPARREPTLAKTNFSITSGIIVLEKNAVFATIEDVKKLFLFLFLIGFFFTGGLFLAHWRPLSPPNSPEPISFYHPASYPLLNRPMVLIVIGKNNGAFVERTLASLFSQSYENYRVIYIDDASQDGSYDLARDLIYESSHLPKVTLVQNEESLGFLANLFRAVESCSDEEIIAVLRGEDWLAHEWVLQKINQYYADSDLWLTYGQYCEYPSYEKGVCRPYFEGDMRAAPFVASHLQTFYAGLFKKIRTPDFLYEGDYFPEATDLVYMIPMLEMAKGHFTYVPEVLYIANRSAIDPKNGELCSHCEQAVRNLTAYAPLPTLFKGEAL